VGSTPAGFTLLKHETRQLRSHRPRAPRRGVRFIVVGLPYIDPDAVELVKGSALQP
jgi:hypothetical protein